MNNQNLQSGAQINAKVGQKRDNALIRKQKELMKDIRNPIDDIEAKLSKQMKNKAIDEESSQGFANELLKPTNDKFNKIFNSMNNFKNEEKHVDVHEEKEKLGGGHEIHEGDHRDSKAGVRKQRHTMGNQGVENVQ